MYAGFGRDRVANNYKKEGGDTKGGEVNGM